MTDCVFCDIAFGRAPAAKFEDLGPVVIFEPLAPVVPGHMLVVPKAHIEDALQSPMVTGMVCAAAAEWAGDKYDSLNIMTSVGSAATQTVFHLHFHLVPRAIGDGLMLPWSRQQQEAAEERGKAELG